jgi:hypothetical protein
MRRSLRIAALVALLAAAAAAHTTGGPKMGHAAGPFEPKLTPQSPAGSEEPTIGRMTIDKQYHGGLEATAKGQMLATLDEAQSSGAYVAIERVTGTLDGRTGAFALRHSGTMRAGAPSLEIDVVPGSGSGELAGLTGTMTIEIAADGKHSYTLDYTLP